MNYYEEEQPIKRSLWRQFARWFAGKWRYYRGWKWLIFIGMLVTLLALSYLVFLAKTTSVSTLQEALKATTVVYDVYDQEAGELRSQKGNYVPLDQISMEMRETLVATEDKRFYQHSGFDIQGIGRAFVRLLINRGSTEGGGGSTLTQQLVKNAFLSSDQTLERKLKELFLSLEMEKQYNKEQILEMYLNHAYFGNGVWGIEDAAQKYFGHSASSLNWHESMVLTGLLKGPTIYNPINEYANAIERRNVVADIVAKEGLISQEEAENIKLSPIELYDNFVAVQRYTYPFYFDAVINEAVRLTNIPDEDLQSKGYRIYTNLDQGYQTAIDDSYDNPWIFSDDGTGQPLVQSASVVLNPTTGGIAAVYGGRGDYTIRGFNRATDMKRSPGSTIKPLAVYVPALETGMDSHSLVPDIVRGYGSDNYTPENYDRQTAPEGEVELYYALAQSKNTSAVHLMDRLGIQKSVQKLKQFGIEVPAQDQSLTLALGAFSEGVSPLQLANAYSAFANRGVRQESFFIRRIEDATGKVVYRNEKPAKYMVMTPNVAAEMTSMMLDTYGGYGTGYGAGPDYGLIAGKTGSTEVGDGNMATRDKWMVGYTPDFVVVSWVGLDETGAVSLDELMPSGMGQLFNLQTTGLMGASAQTPFKVTMASQTPAGTQFDVGEFNEQLNQVVEEGSIWLEENADTLWDKVQHKANEIWQQTQSWFQSLEWPF
ncbi:MAG: PBP1A family penicillin-binding protein [Aerococcaceae bacterium]|nr:PBP1A family penicillin-binding protein [Aerococcaceae bacterium]